MNPQRELSENIGQSLFEAAQNDLSITKVITDKYFLAYNFAITGSFRKTGA